MAYQLEKKALKKVNTISATDYIALINNVEKQKNAGNVLITWSDFLAEVGLDLTFINNVNINSATINSALVQNLGSQNIYVDTINEFTFGNGIQIEKPIRYTQGQEFLSGIDSVISPNIQTTSISTDLGPGLYTLANGLVGQEKFIYMIFDNGNATITPDNLLGNTSIGFANVGDSVLLWFNGSDWVVKAINGAALIP